MCMILLRSKETVYLDSNWGQPFLVSASTTWPNLSNSWVWYLTAHWWCHRTELYTRSLFISCYMFVHIKYLLYVKKSKRTLASRAKSTTTHSTVQLRAVASTSFIFVGSDQAILRNSQTDLWRKSRRLGKCAVSFPICLLPLGRNKRGTCLVPFQIPLQFVAWNTRTRETPTLTRHSLGLFASFSQSKQVVWKVDRIPRLLFDKPVSGPNLTLHPILPLFSLSPFPLRLAETGFSLERKKVRIDKDTHHYKQEHAKREALREVSPLYPVRGTEYPLFRLWWR